MENTENGEASEARPKGELNFCSALSASSTPFALNAVFVI